MRTLIVRQGAGPTKISRLIAALANTMAEHGELSVVLQGQPTNAQDGQPTLIKETPLDWTPELIQSSASTNLKPRFDSQPLSDSSLWRADLTEDIWAGPHSVCDLHSSTCDSWKSDDDLGYQ